MISETLEPFLNGGIAILLWAFVVICWLLAHVMLREYTRFGNEINRPDVKEYAIAGLCVVVLCGMTFLTLIFTLSIMGV